MNQIGTTELVDVIIWKTIVENIWYWLMGEERAWVKGIKLTNRYDFLLVFLLINFESLNSRLFNLITIHISWFAINTVGERFPWHPLDGDLPRKEAHTKTPANATRLAALACRALPMPSVGPHSSWEARGKPVVSGTPEWRFARFLVWGQSWFGLDVDFEGKIRRHVDKKDVRAKMFVGKVRAYFA